MGCDIHLYVEKRNESGVWETADTWGPDEDSEEGDTRLCVDWEDYLYRHRNYELFAVLADVRNYAKVPPIAAIKELPKDICSEVASEIAYWKGDGHSHNWYTLRELVEFDWNQTIENRRYTKQTGPRSWYGGATCEPGKGQMTTYRELVGEHWMQAIEKLKGIGDLDSVRIIFFFDN